MNKLIIVGLVCVLCVAIPPKAKAINEEWSAVAGFVGGVLFHAATQDYYARPAAPTYYHQTTYVNTCPPRPSGRWETVRTREWVPGYWEVYYTRCGQERQRWVEGYWQYTTQRQWVAYNY